MCGHENVELCAHEQRAALAAVGPACAAAARANTARCAAGQHRSVRCVPTRTTRPPTRALPGRQASAAPAQHPSGAPPARRAPLRRPASIPRARHLRTRPRAAAPPGQQPSSTAPARQPARRPRAALRTSIGHPPALGRGACALASAPPAHCGPATRAPPARQLACRLRTVARPCHTRFIKNINRAIIYAPGSSHAYIQQNHQDITTYITNNINISRK
jgi:hypothetical protein